MTEKELKRMEQLYRSVYYVQNTNKISISSGLIQCSLLDEQAAEALEAMGITPAIYYQTRPEITTRGDRIAAAKYYAQFIEDISKYSMHHTADGLYIIPVLTEIHENTRHIGGSYKIHKRQYIELSLKYDKEKQQQQQKAEEDILQLFDI